MKNTTRGFGSNDPSQKNQCMEKLVTALGEVGYREGENLFGAPYDFRHAPAPPGMSSFAFYRFVTSLRVLVERATEKNGNMPVILVTHSLGGPNAMEFLNRRSLPWRRRYIKHLVMLAAGAGGGSVPTLQILAAGVSRSSPSPAPVNALSFANTTRSFPSTLLRLPSPDAFGHAPLVVARAKNYSAYDMPAFLAAVGFSDDEVGRFRTRALPVTLNLRAPAVPVTCVNGVGTPTAEKLVYWDGDFGAAPQVVYGDGDGLVNLANVLALNKVMRDDPNQPYFKSVLIPNATHAGIISDDVALESVINEILEANRTIY